jgi:hypothetical protein
MAARSLSNANAEIVPPPHVPLGKADLPFFANVIGERARSDWTAHQLELAAMLARMMADLDREQTLLREGGAVVAGIANPRKSLVKALAAKILAFRRTLSLDALSQGGDIQDIARRRAAAKNIESALPADDLLARWDGGY